MTKRCFDVIYIHVVVHASRLIGLPESRMLGRNEEEELGPNEDRDSRGWNTRG